LKLGSWRRRISLPHHLSKLTLTGFGNEHGNVSSPLAHECSQGGRFHCPRSSRGGVSPSRRADPGAGVCCPPDLLIPCVLVSYSLWSSPCAHRFQLFASWPIEQRALGLVLAGGDFDQAPDEMGSARFHLWSGQPMADPFTKPSTIQVQAM
jgi:hypothetical protein